jgi:hypothetical protein
MWDFSFHHPQPVSTAADHSNDVTVVSYDKHSFERRLSSRGPVQRRQRDPLGLFDCIEKQILIHPREFCMLWRAGGVA